MLRITASAVVPAAPERVWDIICDTTRYAEWVERTDEVPRSVGPAREDSVYEEINPVLGAWKARTRWTVVEFAPPRRQVHTSEDVPLARRFDVMIELQPEGTATRMTLTLRATPALGPVGFLFERLMRGRVERDTRKTVENLVDLVRRDQAAKSPA
jgi:carbon monoxide dehydrogenase subunit G